MNVRIMFNREAGYLGRSGYGRAKGVEVYDWGGKSDVLFISPVTPRGDVAKCEVRVPKDADDIEALAKALQEVATKIRNGEEL